MITPKQPVTVFDFDGTLSRGDANAGFWKYCFKRSVRPWLFLPVILIGVFFRMFDKSRFTFNVSNSSTNWRGMLRSYLTPKMVKKFAPNFIKEFKSERFGWVSDKIAEEHAAGRKVILISASPEYLVKGLVKDLNFDAVISSEMDPKRPYKYKFLCWGYNKVAALDKWAKANKISPILIHSYADSKSDTPLMSLAQEQVWVNSKTGIRKNAA